MSLRWSLKWSYLALAVGAVGCLGTYPLLPPALQGWRDFMLNLGTGFLGILFTVLLIDTVIRRGARQERRRYQRVALQQLHFPLENHLRLLCNMYKASVERKPDREISSLEDLFSEHYFEQITYFNAMGPSGATRGVYEPEIPWFEYLHLELQRFKEDLGRIVDKYAIYLDPDTLDLLERLANSSFVNGAAYLPMTVAALQSAGHQGAHNPFILEQETFEMRDNTRVFSRVVNIYNREAADDRKVLVRDADIWRDNVAPAVGSSRALYRRLEESERPAGTDHQTEPDTSA